MTTSINASSVGAFFSLDGTPFSVGLLGIGSSSPVLVDPSVFSFFNPVHTVITEA